MKPPAKDHRSAIALGSFRRLSAAAALAVALLPATAAVASSVQPMTPLHDVLTLSTTVATEVTPDIAVVTFAAEASGADVAALTREVQQVINAALVRVRETAGVEARTGVFSTLPRWSPKGGRDGWTVRAELTLKSRDIGVLGELSGRLAQQRLMIIASTFEVSRELREREEAMLIERGIASFRARASLAARAFGFTTYTLREVQLGSAGGDGSKPPPRPVMARAAEMAAAAPEPVALEGGRVTLSLTVAGSILMTR